MREEKKGNKQPDSLKTINYPGIVGSGRVNETKKFRNDNDGALVRETVPVERGVHGFYTVTV